jgi:hypothetical protein
MLTIVSGVPLRSGLFTLIMLIDLAFDKPARATRHVTKLQRLRDEHVTSIHSPRNAEELNRPSPSSLRRKRREPPQLLRRVKAAHRLQGCDRLRRRGMAAHSSGFDSFRLSMPRLGPINNPFSCALARVKTYAKALPSKPRRLTASFAQACNPTLNLLNRHEIDNPFSGNPGAQHCSKPKLDEFKLPWMMCICA